MSSSSNGRCVKVLKAQIHEAHNLGGIVQGATTAGGATIPTTITSAAIAALPSTTRSSTDTTIGVAL